MNTPMPAPQPFVPVPAKQYKPTHGGYPTYVPPARPQ